MAHMIPATWTDRNVSHAEGIVYRRLRDQTPDDWYACHSVGLTSHAHKPWAEIDFVVVGPFGVMCLEVKGGRITVEDGNWTTNGIALKESPFQQAGGGAAALHRELAPHFPSLARAVVGYGVAFPDVTFDRQAPGVTQALVFDDRDLARPFETYIQRLAAHWLDYHGRTEDRFRPLSRGERTAVMRYIAPSFDLVPTLRARIAEAEAELLALTTNQSRVLRGLRSKDRAIVRGGAGTGKTLLAVDEALRFSAGGKRVLLCCRSRQLARYIRAHLRDESVEVRGYEDLLHEIVETAGRSDRIPDADDEDVLNIFLPEQACEAIIDLDRAGSYDVLIVDEAQDLLLEGALDVLDLLLSDGLDEGVWRFFLDHKQNVFSAVDQRQLSRVVAAAGTEYDLVDNCRNTPQIGSTTCMLSAVDPDDVLAGDGPEVELRWVLDRREDARAAASVLRSWQRNGVESDSIVVVATDEDAAERILRFWPAGQDALRRYDSPGQGPQLTVAADFKGLEAAAIVVVGVRELHERETLRRMYVACSRARVLLAIVIDEAAREDFDVRAVEYARMRTQTASGGGAV